jgi:glucosyl-3-phosphoglycerate synthase
VARPAIALFHPELSGIAQPLGGEYAGRRRTLEAIPFAGGYGVDLGLLIDVLHLRGIEAIAHVAQGERRHRNPPRDPLRAQAAEVLHVALRRAGVDTAAAPLVVRPHHPTVAVETRDRPPLSSLAPLPAP